MRNSKPGKKRSFSPNITVKFTAYLVLASVIPILLVGVNSYQLSQAIIKEEVVNFTAAMVEEQKNYLDLLVQEVQSLIANISSVEDITNELDNPAGDMFTSLATQARIGYILNNFSNIKGLVSIDIFTVTGVHYHVGDTLNTQHVREDVRAKIFAYSENPDPDVVWLGIEDNVNADSSHQKVISAVKTFTRLDPQSLQSKTVALLLINYSVESLYDHFINFNLGKGSYMMVIDNENRIVFHPERSLIGEKVSQGYIDLMQGSQGNLVSLIDQQEMLMTYSRSDLNGWLVVSVIPVNTLTARTSSIRNNTMLMVAISLLIVAFLTYLYARNVVSPIREITQAFQMTEHGLAGTVTRLAQRGSDEIGQLVRWFNTFLDNQSAKQLAEDALRERTAELSQANKDLARALQARDEFLANMSHELRTPLNAILGITEAMADSTYGPVLDEQQRPLKTIHESGQHLLSLINDILDLSKIEAGEFEIDPTAISVEELCYSSMRFVTQMAQKKAIQASYEVAPGLRMVWGDTRRLKQILVNLLTNAVKFTPKNGQVGLKAYLNEARDTVLFTVWDTGVGISADDQSRLFKPFVQIDSGLDRHHEGTGLGLALVSRLAQMHGGEVTLESAVGQGSRFTVSIPLPVNYDSSGPAVVEPAAPVKEPAPPPDPQPAAPVPAGRPFLILLAEDNEANSFLMGDFLKSKGYQVIFARDGVEAETQALQARPDLILMDVQMPNRDGLEATRRIRACQEINNIPIIALTALAMAGDAEMCLAAGVNEYTTKPVSLKKLMLLVRKYSDAAPAPAADVPAP